MIRRIKNEEGIRKLVPLTERRRSEKEQHHPRAQNITYVVVACKDIGLELFEQLL